MKPSGKGKWPWVEYNDDKVSDSALCITYLNRVRGVDLNSRLTPAERATALAFQRLAEDSLYWAAFHASCHKYPGINQARELRHLRCRPLYAGFKKTVIVMSVFTEEFPTLVAYCERMRSKFWPDWDECTTHGGTREATK
nr:hypothetical protein BaRGS_012409 [Batillaria attramentaria]